MLFSASEIAGLEAPTLIEHQGQHLRPEVLPPLLVLQQQALAEGFDLRIASAYRSFSRQQHIWNQKAQGRRPLLSDAGDVLDCERLSREQKLWAILRWSALPGASRHHWGTDFDVFDASALEDGDTLQLTYAETVGAGPFAQFHRWLDKRLAEPDCPFFRPYTRPLGGVAPEPWHLSYAPLSGHIQKQINVSQLRQIIVASDIELKDCVLARLEDIFDGYVWVPWALYPPAYRDCGV